VIEIEHTDLFQDSFLFDFQRLAFVSLPGGQQRA
jgi:hypothetical protein